MHNLLNINKADREQLSKIGGIGGQLADELIRYRGDHDGFKSVDEIERVPGFDHISAEKVKRSVFIDMRQ